MTAAGRQATPLTGQFPIRSRVGTAHVEVADGRRYDIISPVDGRALATVEAADAGTVDAAVAEAVAAHRAAHRLGHEHRRELCHRVADEVSNRRDDLARTVTLETGRPLAGALAEVDKAASGFRLAGEEAVRLRGDSVPVAAAHKLVLTRWRSTGVWAVLTPWNFPLNIPVEYLGPILATGNTAVWKPAPTTAGSAALLMECLQAAGVPDGEINLLVTDEVATSQRLVAHPDVVGVCLTGGTPTGTAVARAAAGKRLLLELGGNGPMVVFHDADLQTAAEAVAISCFTASGQVCSAGGRVLVDRRVAAPLAEAVAERAARYPVGDPFDPATVLGPVHLETLARAVEEQVAAAVAGGARLLTGGRHLPGFPTSHYLPATVVDRVPVSATLNTDETFGPVAPIVPLSEAELLPEANRRTHALSAAVFTRDLGRALHALDELRFGTVVVNDRSTYWELHLPFGGWAGKGSGTGRVGVPEVVRQLCQVQTVSLAAGPRPAAEPTPPPHPVPAATP